MIPPGDDKRFALLLQHIAPGSKLLRFRPLTGGVSAQVTALETLRPDGRTERLVVRQHGATDLTHNPQIALQEFTLLQRLHSKGMATPEPLYLDTSREIFPEPVLVMEYIEGTPGFPLAPGIDPLPSFVTHLTRIHALDGILSQVSFLPQQADIVAAKLRTQLEKPAEQTEEERHIAEVLNSVWPGMEQRNPSVLLHGDYWPGNTLWNAGELVAVIDWEDAAIGDPLADLANSRLEILWALWGTTRWNQFTNRYQTLNPSLDITNLPFWDLWSALRPTRNLATWGLDPHVERTMHTGLQQFVAEANAKLSEF